MVAVGQPPGDFRNFLWTITGESASAAEVSSSSGFLFSPASTLIDLASSAEVSVVSSLANVASTFSVLASNDYLYIDLSIFSLPMRVVGEVS